MDEVTKGAVVTETQKKTKKLAKIIEGNVITITESATGSVLTFDAGTLPAEIQAKLMPYGLSQKLGDAAAGKSGQEAVDAITKVFEGLAKGDWSTRAPAEPKITKKSLVDTYTAMPEGKEKKALKAALEAIGVRVE